MANLNIIIPIWQFGKAGGLRVLSKLANAFKEMGHNVLVISYYKNNEEPYFPIECDVKYVDEEGNFAEPTIEPKKNRLTKNLEEYTRYKALLNALNNLSDRYDIALANANKTAFSVSKSKIKNKFYYIQAYEAWYTQKIGFVYNYLAKKSYKLNNLIKIVNADLYKDYKEIHTDYVVPPGLDLDLYHIKDKSAYWDKKRSFVIGHIGRIEEWKGSRETAEAVKILQKEGVNVKYQVAFNPPAEDICDYELVKPDGDVNLSNYYRSVGVLVAPCSIQLGAIHYPVIEAMACGTPVVTTGYYPATNENAYIVGVNSPNEISNAVKDIMNNYNLAMQKVQIANDKLKEFAWDKVSEKMIDIIVKNLKK